jgi:hypothetical protein
MSKQTTAVLSAEHAAHVSAAYDDFDNSFHDVKAVICAIQSMAMGSDDAGAERNREALMHIYSLAGVADRLCEGTLFATGVALRNLAEVPRG